MTVILESVSSALMAAISLSGVRFRFQHNSILDVFVINSDTSGQTSCWPCPTNTTTDMAGASSLDMCKSHACPFYAKVSINNI